MDLTYTLEPKAWHRLAWVQSALIRERLFLILTEVTYAGRWDNMKTASCCLQHASATFVTAQRYQEQRGRVDALTNLAVQFANADAEEIGGAVWCLRAEETAMEKLLGYCGGSSGEDTCGDDGRRARWARGHAQIDKCKPSSEVIDRCKMHNSEDIAHEACGMCVIP